jgi:hypothetical protein
MITKYAAVCLLLNSIVQATRLLGKSSAVNWMETRLRLPSRSPLRGGRNLFLGLYTCRYLSGTPCIQEFTIHPE